MARFSLIVELAGGFSSAGTVACVLAGNLPRARGVTNRKTPDKPDIALRFYSAAY
jgi:hypothetical protein